MGAREELRCPNCAGLITADAEWCGQCFTSLSTPAAPDPVTPGVIATAPAREADAGDPAATPPGRRTAAWTCPACQHANDLELDRCSVCGTPFAALFRDETVRPRADARTAITRSLIFPGLGHRAVGHGADGFARAMLFSWTLGFTVLILASGASSGPVAGLLALYGSLAVAVYVFSAVEAGRMAGGAGPLVPSRVLLWGAVGLVLLSVLMATLVIFAAARS